LPLRKQTKVGGKNTCKGGKGKGRRTKRKTSADPAPVILRGPERGSRTARGGKEIGAGRPKKKIREEKLRKECGE